MSALRRDPHRPPPPRADATFPADWPLRANHSTRAGYTLIEVLVALAILAVLAVVVLPVIGGEGTAARVGGAETLLEAITDGLDSFAEDVGEWPSSLSQLAAPLAAGDRDICGNEYNGGERGAWSGPYLSRPVATGGLPIGIGTALDAFTRVDGGPIDFLRLTITGVETADADALNARVDGDGDPTAGAVRWTASGGAEVTLTWWVPIQPC